MFGRKASFWIAVGGASVLANFVMELAAARIPNDGLRRFVGFIHKGPAGA